tara:strand:+ start:1451 stop:2485 length:1035 start_codon:yes stop_codon:yes gene_type:complete
MLDNAQPFVKSVTLICPFNEKKNNNSILKKEYSLHSKKKIYIHPIFNKKKKSSFLKRIIFGLKAAYFLKKRNGIILTRSLMTSVYLSIFKIDHFLEIHQEIKGLTKILMINLDFINSKNIIKIIFISRGLSEFYSFKKTNNIVLNDACDTRDFSKKKPVKNIRNVYYLGSFYKGRGIELIEKLALIMKDLNFYAYGMRDEKKLSTKNLKFYNFINYSRVGKILKKADILLMPYQSKISINSINFNDDIVKFISPLKMFEYLATGIPIISSDIKVLRETLIHDKNSVMVKNYENVNAWSAAIRRVKNNLGLRKKIYLNALKTSSKNTWSKRVKKIIRIHEEFYKQ